MLGASLHLDRDRHPAARARRAVDLAELRLPAAGPARRRADGDLHGRSPSTSASGCSTSRRRIVNQNGQTVLTGRRQGEGAGEPRRREAAPTRRERLDGGDRHRRRRRHRRGHLPRLAADGLRGGDQLPVAPRQGRGARRRARSRRPAARARRRRPTSPTEAPRDGSSSARSAPSAASAVLVNNASPRINREAVRRRSTGPTSRRHLDVQAQGRLRADAKAAVPGMRERRAGAGSSTSPRRRSTARRRRLDRLCGRQVGAGDAVALARRRARTRRRSRSTACRRE